LGDFRRKTPTLNLNGRNMQTKHWVGTPFLLALIFSLISAFRWFGPGRDYLKGYAVMFQWAKELPSLGQLNTFPSHDLGFALFLYLLALVHKWPDAVFLFAIGIVFISIKLWCFQRYSPNFVVAALSYFSLFFVLHDYTQLRVGSALALIMLAACLALGSRKFVAGGTLVIGAIGLHLSTILTLPFLIAAATSTGLLLALAGASLFAADLFKLILFVIREFAPNFDPRLASQLALNTPVQPNPVSTLKVYQYISLILFFYYRHDIKSNGWVMVDAAGWFLLVSLALFFGLFSLPELAHRTSELFAIFMPFLIAGLATLLPKKLALVYVATGLVIGFWSSYRILQ
jgi:hypothetical protein